MIIRLIPETEEEKARAGEIEIKGVNEFFVYGNNVTEDGRYNEFHEWTGSYRYLMGTLQYYFEVLNDERREAQNRRKFDSPVPQLKVVEAETDAPDDDVEE